MACPIRDALVVAYFQAQTEQAKAATAMMNETAPDKHNSALRRSATARMSSPARPSLKPIAESTVARFIKSEDLIAAPPKPVA